MSNVFDYGGKPVNKNTAMAVSGGTNYEPDYRRNVENELFKVRPLIPEIPKDSCQINEQSKIYINQRRSRLVVVAWWSNGGKWLCRCDCGYCTVRKLSFLKKKDFFDACPECMHVVKQKLRDHWLKTGEKLSEEYFA